MTNPPDAGAHQFVRAHRGGPEWPRPAGAARVHAVRVRARRARAVQVRAAVLRCAAGPANPSGHTD